MTQWNKQYLRRFNVTQFIVRNIQLRNECSLEYTVVVKQHCMKVKLSSHSVHLAVPGRVSYCFSFIYYHSCLSYVMVTLLSLDYRVRGNVPILQDNVRSLISFKFSYALFQAVNFYAHQLAILGNSLFLFFFLTEWILAINNAETMTFEGM